MPENPMSEKEFKRVRALIRPYSRLNSWVYRVSGGRWMRTMQGRPIMVVTMRGAKSGKERNIPLMHVPYKQGVIVVGSQGGAPKSPVWVKNLQVHPEIVVQVDRERMKLRARQVDDAEKAEVWPICVQHYAEFDDYQRRTDGNIPVFVCEPR